ncbi:MAG: Bifunctional protein: zinc-containing alcohol dehydrogenase; quinone oxidoreductase (NADPH:quinone reductase); Similar to arginate lyase [uncultured Rubrobacteraceae bacterium]|uniref:Zinc-type alcohol dehydrogenase-like protein n=1 Tax=uncultured Rubrobacteraceae bacterium TaxID=349277 RepID=A0A6J4PCM6_9ACTN|nr:MAG: Bifunctional protein: zinc-containing alcohol dehydrogenase; quinone oxidoreductase (NADPH:quinone reductase); Similar to arginate lyase [uncultured Rubrobacteraceae bacterium]
MKAVGLYRYLPVDDPESLVDVEVERPTPTGRDLLVRVGAVSVNPVDVKVRAPKDGAEEAAKVLGYDAAGVVEQVGEGCELFAPGDEVYYAGSIDRPGSNSEYHLVDERIVGKKPRTLGFGEAAALPLTGITAWEALFERLGVGRDGSDGGRTVLVIGGAGGVGSVAIQLAKTAGLTVVATASREESASWCRGLGADHIVDHREPLPGQLEALGFEGVDYILCCNSMDKHWEDMAEAIRPQGKICSIVEARKPLDLSPLVQKSATFAHEWMFTKAVFQTEDMVSQHELLGELADLVDVGSVRTTMTEKLAPIDAANLRAAHAKVETGRMVGKVVLEGFGR